MTTTPHQTITLAEFLKLPDTKPATPFPPKDYLLRQAGKLALPHEWALGAAGEKYKIF
jgi:hypothetical protein